MTGSAREAVYDALRHFLRHASSMQPSRAVDRLVARTGMSSLRVAEGLTALKKEGLLVGVTDGGHVVGRLAWVSPPAEDADPFADHWRKVVVTTAGDRAGAIGDPPKAARDLAVSDVSHLVVCLAECDLAAFPGEDRYVLSANTVMGSSKVLDSFPGIVGPELRRPQRPLFVVTAGPSSPRAVLFVENPSAFGSLLRTAFIAEHLVVCTFGYGLTLENLPQRLGDGSVIPCAAAGEPVANFAGVLAATPCFHWGDLDLEGLRIFERLRSAIPHLQLAAIYGAMMDRLADPRRSHPYSALFDKAGQNMALRKDDPIVEALATACSERAVDQEAMCPVKDFRLLTTPFYLP